MARSSLTTFVLALAIGIAIALVMPTASAVEGAFAEIDASVVQGNYAKARRLLDEMAQRGDTEAMYRLANLYRAGVGIPQDLKESARLYEQAATAGHVPSQYMVGQCYERGIGIPTDIVKAGEWYTRAARSGDTRALERLQSLSQKPGDLLTIIAMPDEDAVLGQLNGRDLTIADEQGQTLLMAASAAGHARVVAFLLGAHLDANQRDRAERTALFYAAEQGRDAVIEALLDAGANPNVADRNGDTPLHVAIAHRQAKCGHAADASRREPCGAQCRRMDRGTARAGKRRRGRPFESRANRVARSRRASGRPAQRQTIRRLAGSQRRRMERRPEAGRAADGQRGRKRARHDWTDCAQSRGRPGTRRSRCSIARARRHRRLDPARRADVVADGHRKELRHDRCRAARRGRANRYGRRTRTLCAGSRCELARART